MSHLRPRAESSSASMLEGVAGEGANNDSYFAKLVTYIPAESIGTYQALAGVVPQENQSTAMPWVALALLGLTPIWMYFATKEKDEPAAWFQVITSVPAFAVWLFALQSPLATWIFGDYKPFAGSIALIVATALIPLLEKVFKR